MMTSLLPIWAVTAIMLDHAHLASPIVLAWSSKPFRAVMMRQWEWYLLLPFALVAVSVIIGLEASSGRHLPQDAIFYSAFWQGLWEHGYVPNGWLWGLITVYFVWNAWHFGAQHYGVACLAGWRSGPRWFRRVIIIAPTMAIMLGFIPIVYGVMGFVHWVTDIGLSAGARRKLWWIFLLVVLPIGLIGFVFKTPWTEELARTAVSANGVPLTSAVLDRAIPVLIGLRCGFGFVHFLYSRWVWQTRARELFSAA